MGLAFFNHDAAEGMVFVLEGKCHGQGGWRRELVMRRASYYRMIRKTSCSPNRGVAVPLVLGILCQIWAQNIIYVGGQIFSLAEK